MARIEGTQPLELLYTDLSGPISPASGAGNSYVTKFTDHHTRLKSVYFLIKKNEAIDALINYTQDVVIPSGHRLQRLHSDHGGRVHWTGVSRVLPTDRNQAGICGNEHTAAKWHLRT